jgi:cytochrome c-type biogenesis protein CcmF
VIAAALVLYGTLYPLFIDALTGQKISVGPPYFNAVFLTPMLPLAALLGLGMHSIWKSMRAATLLQRLVWPAVIAAVFGVITPFVFYGHASWLTVLSTILGVWVCASSLLEPVRKWVRREGAPLTRAQIGMYLAHFGVGVFVLGATLVSAYTVETDVPGRPGDRFSLGGYDVVFRDVHHVDGPNFVADEGEFELRKGGDLVTVLHSQQRLYRVQQSALTEAAIDSRFTRDVFVALGEPLGDGAWSLRLQVKPFIRFLWLGAILMALGGLIAITDRRYRLPVRDRATETGAAPARGTT